MMNEEQKAISAVAKRVASNSANRLRNLLVRMGFGAGHQMIAGLSSMAICLLTDAICDHVLEGAQPEIIDQLMEGVANDVRESVRRTIERNRRN